MTERRADGPRHAEAEGGMRRNDPYLDAIRAFALLAVVAGHWLATLPRLDGSRLLGADHLLGEWSAAGWLTWGWQVVPIFMMVSAAVTVSSADRVNTGETTLAAWWGGRALRLARPAVTYLCALTVLVAMVTGYSDATEWLQVFDASLTVHLWFLVALLLLQLALPLAVEADRRFGLWPVAVLAGGAVLVDVVRATGAGPLQLSELGAQVTSTGGGVGWANWLFVWLVPQQLGIAWRNGRLTAGTGALLAAFGLAWLFASTALGYPVAMVGGDLDGSTNVLPPTAALLGVVWLQAGLAVAAEPLVRRFTSDRPRRWLTVMTSIGMALYLWHKLAELPAAWVAARVGLPIDAGLPGDAGFWTGRLTWIAACTVMVLPVIAAVGIIEKRRVPTVPVTDRRSRVVLGGVALIGGLGWALWAGAVGGAAIALVAVGAASELLRRGSHRGTTADAAAERAEPAPVTTG